MPHRLTGLLAIASLAAACVPAPRAPIDLETVETRSVRFGPAGPRAAVCPGQPTRLDVALDVVDREGDAWRLLPHRRDVTDAIFDVRQLRVSSPQGFFDGDGVFYPDADVTKSVQTGFVLYARTPNGPSFSVRFPPSYECTAEIGGAGAPGWNGGAGERGPSFSVFVTWVRTPDYTKLLAARALGEIDRLTLVAPGTPLVARSRGGQGGAGVYDGAGGDGGSGGDITIVIDERYDDLERLVTSDVRGGEGGPGGYDEIANRLAAESVRGRPGKRGPPGRVTIALGEARSRFDGLGAIVAY